MGSDDRDFVNIDLSSEEVQSNYLNKEKRRKYLNDMERLRRIREASRKRNPERYASTAAAGEQGSVPPEGTDKPRRTPGRKRRRRKRSGGFARNLIIILCLLLGIYGVRSLLFGRSNGGREARGHSRKTGRRRDFTPLRCSEWIPATETLTAPFPT